MSGAVLSKVGVVLVEPEVQRQWTVLMGYPLLYQQMLAVIKHVIDDNTT